ncbi:hypothetical protein FRC03_011421 [Tulasnella sp. 419]|nr:hypothetical protein FRC03_011421 [Tulasnella sp. 419]
MIVYFLCRYFLLFALIGINVSLNSTDRLDCQALYTFNQVAGNIAIGSSSTLLMLRTFAIWSRNLYVIIPLTCLALGQWSILFYGVLTVRSNWAEEAHSCIVTGTYNLALNLIYIYTMAYDLVVLSVTITGLVRVTGRSGIWQLLFADGLFYFIVAFTANLIPAVFLILNLNPAMNIMFTVPAAVASTIVATRGFVRLANWTPQEAHSSGPTPPRGAHFTPGIRSKTTNDLEKGGRSLTKSGQEGIHISTEAYTISDNIEFSKELDRIDESSDDGQSISSNSGRRTRFAPTGARTTETPAIKLNNMSRKSYDA